MINPRRDDTFHVFRDHGKGVYIDPREVIYRLQAMINIAGEYRGYAPSSLLVLMSEEVEQSLYLLDAYREEMRCTSCILKCDYLVLEDKRSLLKIGVTIKLGVAREQDIPFEDTNRYGYRDECLVPVFDRRRIRENAPNWR